MDYLASFHNAEDNVTGLVFMRSVLHGDGRNYAAALRDDDSGHIVGCIAILPTLEAAVAMAREFAA